MEIQEHLIFQRNLNETPHTLKNEAWFLKRSFWVLPFQILNTVSLLKDAEQDTEHESCLSTDRLLSQTQATNSYSQDSLPLPPSLSVWDQENSSGNAETGLSHL